MYFWPTTSKLLPTKQSRPCMDQPGINSPFRVLPLRDFDWNSNQFVYLTQCAGSTEWRVNSCVWRLGKGGWGFLNTGRGPLDQTLQFDLLGPNFSPRYHRAGFVFSGPHFDYCPPYELVAFLQLGTWRHCVLFEKCHWDTLAKVA